MWTIVAIRIEIGIEEPMRTVQMTLDEKLVKAVDRVSRKLGRTRSAFTREALRDALERIRGLELEKRDREGYLRNPVRPAEFDIWHDEQVWPEDDKSLSR